MLRTSSDRRGLRVVAACWLAIWAAAPAAAQTVTGAVTLTAADKAPRKADYSGAIVWLEPVGAAPRSAPAPLKQATMAQRQETFRPHLLAIEVGTAVDFPNDDPMFHNVFSNYDGQVFDVQIYAPKTSRRVVFRRAGLVYVFCNIHEAMSAVIAVLPSPYFTITGPDGRFQIRPPAGQYRLRVWHERVEPEVASRLERVVTVGPGDIAIPDTALPLSTQPVMPHKNKYGQSYAFAPSNRVFYPGSRR
jgi:plastocyanin